MNWQDLCCMCCGDRQAFWDKLARQLQRYRYCANGDCTEDAMHEIPGQNNEPMDPETFMLFGFMILPMLFILFGLYQRLGQRRRELPQGKPGRELHDRDQGPPTPPLD
eukprot:CAMPEP_0184311106 /NCGR_PEP_ID=MMETSP1049-20130417/38105_1 /TAXON_ID=77928 /ORGANISM="Proteomonas sulcata, Strain CCMP704" /LENGTH=107 /DNA_ID=CAMNT_0026626137 /DNA_START=54 /DNA_END=377 /DNA_ORIENTATION=+